MHRFATPLTVGLLSAALQFFNATTLRYERLPVAAGQWWRLLSGHLIHLGWSHWAMNMAGLLLVWLLFEPVFRSRHALLELALASVGISICLYLFSPQVIWYVGLSGALHALIVIGLLGTLPHDRRFSLLVLAGVVAKLVWEQVYGALPGSAETAGGPVVVVAHSYGAVLGLLLFAAGELLRRARLRLQR